MNNDDDSTWKKAYRAAKRREHDAGRAGCYMGVSKSSVSKWETETTLPDILLLPQLATLFNVSVDELIGYEPQLSMEAVNKLYLQLSAEWSRDSANAYAHSEELIRKYYSCFPFLLQMAGFISITTCCMKNQNWL